MKLATLELIRDVTPISGADNIVLATVLEWEVVISKESFNVGDMCVFIPIDTLVDTSKPHFAFLANPKSAAPLVQIKTRKIRGVWSQGLIVPSSCLPPGDYEIGADVSSILGVTKYEKQSIINSGPGAGQKGDFPTSIISKTDEDNLRTKNVLPEYVGKEVVITKKMDGSSMTLIFENGELTVCSRNYIVNDDTMLGKYVQEAGIPGRLREFGRNVAIQGEFCGPKVNGNRIGLKLYHFYVFTARDLDTRQYYDHDSLVRLCQALGLEMVPLLDRLVIDESWKVSTFQKIANDVIYVRHDGLSVPGEGIVIRPVVPVYSRALGKYLSTKVINQQYKD